jgi:glycosyltransferase involved in cell wall biosynthesis
MNILHLYSNHKWTGPADHALNLVAWQKKTSDLNPILACGYKKGAQNYLREKARERQLPCLDNLFLNKHLSWKIAPDVISLKKIVARHGIDVIHCHQDNDALTAVAAGLGRQVVRTNYDGQPPDLSFRQQISYRQAAQIMTASHRVGVYLSAQYPDKNIEQVDIPVDLARYFPSPKSRKLLDEFGIGSQEPIAGIVARVQKQRNFALLLDAIEQVVAVIPTFRFLIVGRGTHIDALARQPVKQRRLEQNVIFTGYRRQDYREVLNLFDYKIFLTPGSDGSCRAAREAMACGKPVVAARRGILSELIADGKTGILVESQAAALAAAMVKMATDHDFRKQCSRAARSYAEAVLNPDRYVKKVAHCYRAISD